MNMSAESESDKKERLFNEANAAWDKGDLGKAFGLFTQSAKLGDHGSQLDLGYFYDIGLHVKMDKKKAMFWYHKAYMQGHAGGANNIATVYRDLGDAKKMILWFKRAAAMGDIDVMLDLGKRYELGDAVVRDIAKAKKYYLCAVAHKDATKGDKLKARRRLLRLRKSQAAGKQMAEG
jgi:hypothetical protein